MRRVLAAIITVSIFTLTFPSRAHGDLLKLDEQQPGDFLYKAETRYAIDPEDLTEEQLSSLAMLNYMTVLTKEINASSNSRVFLDDAYSSIVNNVNPDVIDPETLDEINIILDTIQAYKMIDKKRERIKYIYDQNKAQALKNALPNPVGLLSAVASGDILRAAASVIYMAVDSAASYKAYASQVELKYMEDGWQLDDEAAEALHESRSDAFTYMVNMCTYNDLPAKLALTENAVDEFVKWENNTSTVRRIEFLENNVSTYKAYGKYWLVLAKSYFENGEYEKCLSAVTVYNSLNVTTFRKNHELARMMPMVLISAENELSNKLITKEQYIALAKQVIETILDNIETADWDLRYYAAQACMDVAGKTGDKEYLRKSFELTKQNINYLVDTQIEKNNEYLAKLSLVKEEDPDKKDKKQYNKWLKEERKIEQPPVFEPLRLNCDLLFALADEIDISQYDKQRVDEILHEGGKRLFLIDQLDEAYWFNKPGGQQYSFSDISSKGSLGSSTFVLKEDNGDVTEMRISDVLKNRNIYIPTRFLPPGSNVRMTIIDGSNKWVITNWNYSGLELPADDKRNIGNIQAIYSSDEFNKFNFTSSSKIVLEIIPELGSRYNVKEFNIGIKSLRDMLFDFQSIQFEMVG